MGGNVNTNFYSDLLEHGRVSTEHSHDAIFQKEDPITQASGFTCFHVVCCNHCANVISHPSKVAFNAQLRMHARSTVNCIN